MILTVTLNAAIDRTLIVPNFAVGFRHRAIDTLTLPGGKGVNVARVLKNLGQPVIVTGFAGGRTGNWIVADLGHEGILSDFVRIEKQSRTSTAVLDPTGGTTTEMNEYGPEVTEAEIELLRKKIDYLTKAADIVVLAGSLPRGVSPDIYAELISQIHAHGVTVLLDTFGEPLRLALKTGPDVVFPNQVETETVIGYEFSGSDGFIRAAADLRELGAKSAVVTHRYGCAAQLSLNSDLVTLVGRVPHVEVVSAVGSGDALVAGYALKMLEGASAAERLRFGLACAVANTLQYGAGVLSQEDVDGLVPAVQVEGVPEQ